MTAAMVFTLALSFSAFFFLLQAEASGFHVDLIHRDSPKSPFFNPSETYSQRLINSLQRSIRRANNHYKANLSISPTTAQSTIVSNNGEYLMQISIGTPPVKILGIADTGSDLLWTQCKPCTHCYDQKDPLFDPKASSSYQEIPCSTQLCKAGGGSTCQTSGSKEICNYSIAYGDESFSQGTLAWETVLLASTNGKPVSFPKTVFGCGYNNNGSFDSNGSGIIGLGRGAVSLISRMQSSIGGKFSYCLIPIFSETVNTTKMNFGSKAIVSGPGVVSTPIISKDPSVFYFLTLEAMSVGDERLEFKNPNNSEGNIIIDSGTTLTILPEDFYDQLESKVIRAIGDLERVYDPKLLSLCYKTKSDEFGAPVITTHFTNADVKLQQVNTFVRFSEDVVCFAFASGASISFSIFGNLAQMNFLIGYDLEQKTVSFKQADCRKL